MTPTVVDGDLPKSLASELARAPVVAVDTETSGLDWRENRLQMCQLFTGNTGPIILRHVSDTPKELAALMASRRVLKVLHFAPFDLRFLQAQWNVPVRNIACTKAASKLLSPDVPNQMHSLGELVRCHLGVTLDKGSVRISDWGAPVLSMDQLKYAVGDVEHLPELYAILIDEVRRAGLDDLYRSICDYMPIDAHLDVSGMPNPLTY